MTNVYSICRYPGKDADWKSFETIFIVKALKGDVISDKFSIELKAGKRVLKFDKNNKDELVRMTAKWLSDIIVSKYKNAQIIPIPNSGTTKESTDFAMKKFGEMVAGQIPGAKLLPSLRFSEARPSSRAGGSRIYGHLKENYIWCGDSIPKDAILIDDVTTSGNHLKAAYHFLRERGCTVHACFVVARTRWKIDGSKAIGEESHPLFD